MRVVALLVLLVLELAVFASVSGADMSSVSGVLNYLELKFLDLVPGLAPGPSCKLRAAALLAHGERSGVKCAGPMGPCRGPWGP